MIRIETGPAGELIDIRRDGKLIHTASGVDEAVAKLAELGVEDPQPLVDAVLQWRVVDIRE